MKKAPCLYSTMLSTTYVIFLQRKQLSKNFLLFVELKYPIVVKLYILQLHISKMEHLKNTIFTLYIGGQIKAFNAFYKVGVTSRVKSAFSHIASAA